MAQTRHSALDLLILWTAVPIVSGLDAVGGWNPAQRIGSAHSGGIGVQSERIRCVADWNWL